jgi:hypothetical protein
MITIISKKDQLCLAAFKRLQAKIQVGMAEFIP